MDKTSYSSLGHSMAIEELMITRQGSYRYFTKRNIFGPKDNCLYCGEEPSPEHTFSKYNRCYSEQEAVNLEVPIIVRSENLLQTILEAMEKWEGVRKMLLAEFLLFEL